MAEQRLYKLGERFTYNGRRMVSLITEDNNDVYYGYEASSSEVKRIQDKYGTNIYTPPTGSNFQVVVIGGFNNQGTIEQFPPGNDPGLLGGITNADLSKKILQDQRTFYRLASQRNGTNAATTDPNTPSAQGGTGSVPIEQESANPLPIQSTSTYVYPINMSIEQDSIRFTIFQLKKNPDISETKIPEILKSTGGGKGSFGISGDLNLYDRIGTSIILPIQASIVDQNIANWGSGELNELQRMLAEASATGMTGQGGIAEGFKKTMDSIFGSVQSEPQKYKNILYSYLLEQAVNAPGLTSRLFGGVLNPNMELLFQGPQLRPFNFTFKMSPRSKEEANSVRNIIKTFKKNMAPKVDGIFLQAPNVFKIEYLHGDKVHESMNLIKVCSLQNCSVDYTPLQTYMTYDDQDDPKASMVSYSMSLTFSEITPVYQNDYDTESSHPIGF